MSIEQSYIDIYKQYSGLIKSNSSQVLNDMRDCAFDRFVKNGFPSKRDEDYLNSDVASLFAVDYGINFNQFDISFNPYLNFKCDIQNIKSYLFFVINDVFCDNCPQAQKYIDALASQGVVVGSIRKIAASHPDLVAKYLGKAIGDNSSSFVDFNSAFAIDGFFVYVPKNVTLDAPIQFINIMNADMPLLANSRNLVVLDDNAHCQMMVCDHSAKPIDYLANRVTELVVGRDSSLQVYKLEDTGEKMHLVNSTFLCQDENSDVSFNDMTLQNGFTRNDFRADFAAPNSSLNLSGLAIADAKQHVDNHTFVNHACPRCHSNQLYKYVLSDEAVGVFSGKVLVCKDSQKTEAYQSNKNIVSSSSAKMYTKPHLEIYADDVKCSHGAAVGQLDDNALFYMRQRGISEAEARTLLMIAFGSDVIDSIKIEALRTRMHMLLEHRFRGKSHDCSACDACIN